VNAFTKVDSSMIHYKESRNFKINFDTPTAISHFNNRIYVAGDKKLQIIEPSGKLFKEINLDDQPGCIFPTPDHILIGFKKSIEIISPEGKKMNGWDSFEDSTVITSIAENNGNIYVADAGKRKVWKFDVDGKKVGEIEGKTGNEQIHGFIVPSPYFDLAFNPENELWIVNPGKHSLENYSTDGVLKSFWENQSVKIEGFSGCCNPAHFTFAPDGSFITSEKGLVRIKKYKPSGEFDCVVAPPSDFQPSGHAPEVAVDEKGNIYALDFDRKVIRYFIQK
jgi:DNA-binding beta-propeller fold protein YncE